MAKVEVLMPKMGESVAEATVIRWLKEVGDTVELDEPIMEIATDKVDSEIPSPVEGVLAEQCCQADDVVQVGSPVAYITTDAEEKVEKASAAPAPVKEEKPQPVAEAAPAATNGASSNGVAEVGDIPKRSDSGRFYSPLVRTIAKTEGVSIQELETIEGSGQGGRVTKSDILNYLPNRGSELQTAPQPVAAPAKAPHQGSTAHIGKVSVPLMPGDEIVEMDRMRKLIAEHMVMSKHTSPHVTSYVEADVTNIVLWRNKVKDAFLKKEGEKLTFTPIFIEALVKAIKDMPGVNVSLDGQNIIKRKSINMGMATARPDGNLIVPVIKNADQMNLLGLTKAVNDLADRARNNKLAPEEIQGGTYTITNVGTFGNVMGTPIINQPQVAIMAVGAIRKKPAVIETPSGDAIAIRHMMFLSHSYDHRIVDGALGGSFVRKVADYLENWDINRTI
ncbi:MAG: 2-oxo acid dehydrogenase subunit E2 [Flavobacteriales bacterium]|nr:2-oxo acid dehydrogenase subunit E2 [Flavobacteriales bacterium]MCB9192507.1 2-oxo acid dehydrogenase subunit E2 [Flavobacteriales bacterium]